MIYVYKYSTHVVSCRCFYVVGNDPKLGSEMTRRVAN